MNILEKPGTPAGTENKPWPIGEKIALGLIGAMIIYLVIAQ